MATTIRRFAPTDEARWRVLWRGYLDFYRLDLPEAVYVSTWRRIVDPDGDIRAFAAGGRDGPVGLTHYFFHPTTASVGPRCYLQDLYVAPEARGHGAGRALIEAVYAEADKEGADQVYWLTHEDNATARALYDRLGSYGGMIKYRRT